MPPGYDYRPSMDIRQLRYFSMLARLGNFGRAASALHIAQPALSRQIRLLEEELGVRLFERHARGSSPTEAAEVLLARAEFVLRYLDQAKNDVAATQRDPYGRVALGMSPGLALTLAAPLFRHVEELYPDVRLRVVEDFTGSLRDRLLQGTVDLAILNGSAMDLPNLVTTSLMDEQICLIGNSDDSNLHRTSIRIEDLAQVPFVLAGMPKAGVREVVETAAARAGVVLEPRVEVESLEVAKRIIHKKALCTAHFAAPIVDDIASGALAAVPIAGLHLSRFIARASNRPASRTSTVLKEAVEQVAALLIRSGRWPHARLAITTNPRSPDKAAFVLDTTI